MLGAILGDIVGSVYEFNNTKDYNFEMFTPESSVTDDSILTVAVAQWAMEDPTYSHAELERYLVSYVKKYPCPQGGYGNGFFGWVFHPEATCDYVSAIHSGNEGDTNSELNEDLEQNAADKLKQESNGELKQESDVVLGRKSDSELERKSKSNPLRRPYNSWGNGSAMRVSSIGWLFDTVEETERVAGISASITHNHPEGIKGAQAVAAAIFLARTGATKEKIKEYIEKKYNYQLTYDREVLHRTYTWQSSCQGTVPQAIWAFLESDDFESALRLAVSLGGDSDTLACITGGISEAYYKEIPADFVKRALRLMPSRLVAVLKDFRQTHYQSYFDSYIAKEF